MSPSVVKVIDKDALTDKQLEQLATEVEILRKLHHPNIVEVLFEDQTASSLYQVFSVDMVSGSSLK